MDMSQSAPPEPQPPARPWANQKFLIGLAVVIVVIATAVVLWFVWHPVPPSSSATSAQTLGYDKGVSATLTNGHCDGVGPKTIVPPMKLDQVGFVLPYGLMTGGHVTPIDHQYYNGLDVHALRDTYDVVAPADGRIVDIQHRGAKTNTPAHTVDVPSSDEYRLVFAHTCSFLTYVDLVTSLDDSIKAKLPAGWTPQNSRDINIPVKQGQVIGHIGGQTLDFAVWDLSQKPLGFLQRKAYDNAEAWKVFTAPPSNYFAPDVKTQTIAKYIRTTTPIDGKIDYDQEGKLVGTWFREGSNGYAGPGLHSFLPGYWFGHLSFAPNYLDPSIYVVSTGNFTDNTSIDPTDTDPGSATASDAKQFWLKADATDPATVTTASGLVKYDLLSLGGYVKLDGSKWDEASFAAVKGQRNNNIAGALLVQMIEAHKLKVEFFPGKTAAQVAGFDNNAKMYNRGEDAKPPKPTNY